MTPDLQIHGHIATLTLRRPRVANRLDPEDLATLTRHVATVNAREEVRVLRLQAEGKYFCSGYDISQIGGGRQITFDQMVDAFEDARPVTVAVIQGGVYGGATDLALACDFRLGADHVDMFMPAARLGLHFYQRGMERYVSRLGVNMAKKLFLTAQKIDAHEMKDCGFLTHLVPADELAAAADDLVHTLAGMAPLAMLGMKKHLTRIARGVLDATELQRDIARAAQSADLKEGAAAWAEKRAPKFKGR
jgi:enoyl-CoA hydratase/carnithine racemase